MDRNRFVVLSLVAFGLVLASFMTLGFGRLVFGFRTAQLLAAPFGLTALALVVVLFTSAVWTTIRGDAASVDED
jgi:hypothetical protein